MFQTIGWNNNVWIERLKKIGFWWTTIVVGLFLAQAIVFTVQARNNYYLDNEKLQEQYAEYWNQQAEEMMNDFQVSVQSAMKGLENDPTAAQKAQQDFVQSYGPSFIEKAQLVSDSFEKQCPRRRTLRRIPPDDDAGRPVPPDARYTRHRGRQHSE